MNQNLFYDDCLVAKGNILQDNIIHLIFDVQDKGLFAICENNFQVLKIDFKLGIIRNKNVLINDENPDKPSKIISIGYFKS